MTSTSSIFLDWFGVLSDAQKTHQQWRHSQASLLSTWFGGSEKEWLKIHDDAFHWWLRKWTRSQKMLGQREQYQSIWRGIEVGWMRRNIKASGLPIVWSDNELFGLDRELVYNVGLKAKITYPWLRNTLGQLIESGYRLFLTSGGDSNYFRGALEATGLSEFFRFVYSPDRLNAVKSSERYWRTVFRKSRSRPGSSIVVDDRADYLQVPGRMGALIVQIGRKRRTAFKPDLRIKSLRELPSALEKIR